MSSSDRLKPIIHHKDQQQKQCLQDMASSKMRWENQQQQLEDLYRYQKEYHQKHHGKDQPSLSVKQLVETRRFMNQLEHTIKQQTEVVKQSEREYLRKKQHWMKVKNNVRAVEHLVENIKNEEHKQADKQEQKLLDEFGLRKKK